MAMLERSDYRVKINQSGRCMKLTFLLLLIVRSFSHQRKNATENRYSLSYTFFFFKLMCPLKFCMLSYHWIVIWIKETLLLSSLNYRLSTTTDVPCEGCVLNRKYPTCKHEKRLTEMYYFKCILTCCVTLPKTSVNCHQCWQHEYFILQGEKGFVMCVGGFEIQSSSELLQRWNTSCHWLSRQK